MNMTRQQITLLGIFALFLAPLLLVFLMRSSWWGYQPEGHKNLGQLVEPPVQLQAGALPQEGKWLVLYVLPENCEQKCTNDIVTLRQIYRATGRQGKHLSIVILNANKTNSAKTDSDKANSEIQSMLESISGNLIFIANPATAVLASLAQISAGFATEREPPMQVRTFVADPMLNVMLAYGENANPGDISKDLKRLLHWSRQDKE